MLDLKDKFDSHLLGVFHNNEVYKDKFDQEYKKILRDHDLNPEYLNLYLDYLIKLEEKQVIKSS